MSRGKRNTTAEPVNLDAVVTVIKTAHCPSSSGRSQLTYQLGKDEEAHLYIKITGNSGNGFYNEEWIGLQRIHDRLSSHKTAFSAHPIKSLFEGQSVNTPHFIAAALLAEGFLIKDPQNTRQYRLGDVEGVKVRAQSLSDPGTMAIKTTATVKTKSKADNNRQSMHAEDESLLDTLLQPG